jgi:hypothetical protein
MELGIQTKLYIPSLALSMMLELPTILTKMAMAGTKLIMRLLLILIPMTRGIPTGALMLHPHVLHSSPVAKFRTTITLPVPVLGAVIIPSNPALGTWIKILSPISFTILWELLLKCHGTFLQVVLMKGFPLEAP